MNKDNTTDKGQEVKAVPRLTRKQQAFVDHLINNPKASATAAAIAAYDDTTYNTAAQIATDNLKKPQIISALGNVNDLVENTLINDVTEYSKSKNLYERIHANNTAKYIHDKIHGKATQRTEVTATSLSVNIDLTGE